MGLLPQSVHSALFLGKIIAFPGVGMNGMIILHNALSCN
jgi:hypothetical protein